MVGAEGIDVPVAQHTALRRTGGAAGVKKDEEVIGRRLRNRFSGVQLFNIGRLYNGDVHVPQDGKKGLVGDEHGGARVLHHKLQALRRIRGIKGKVSAACLKYADGGCEHMQTAAYHYSHNAFLGDF